MNHQVEVIYQTNSKRVNIMNNSNIFKLAHSLTKATVQAGDNYQVTFGASIKFINSVHSINGTDKQICIYELTRAFCND